MRMTSIKFMIFYMMMTLMIIMSIVMALMLMILMTMSRQHVFILFCRVTHRRTLPSADFTFHIHPLEKPWVFKNRVWAQLLKVKCANLDNTLVSHTFYYLRSEWGGGAVHLNLQSHNIAQQYYEWLVLVDRRGILQVKCKKEMEGPHNWQSQSMPDTIIQGLRLAPLRSSWNRTINKQPKKVQL